LSSAVNRLGQFGLSCREASQIAEVVLVATAESIVVDPMRQSLTDSDSPLATFIKRPRGTPATRRSTVGSSLDPPLRLLGRRHLTVSTAKARKRNAQMTPAPAVRRAAYPLRASRHVCMMFII
jgi:hypothetical protein